jgi:hypothetical protein
MKVYKKKMVEGSNNVDGIWSVKGEGDIQGLVGLVPLGC